MRKEMGKLGEEAAQEFLKNKNIKILKTNYRTRFGEIDIIARDHDILIFIEVKTRKSAKYGLPRESVTPRKQQTIQKVALLYIKTHNIKGSRFRFDVIEVYQEKEPWNIVHITNAF